MKIPKDRIFRLLLAPVMAIIVSIVICVPLIVLAGADIVEAATALILGSFGTGYGLVGTLIKTTPLLLIGLGLTVCFKSGLYNIGAEGQLYMGALVATFLGLNLGGIISPLLIPIMIIFAFLMGALWALIPVILKVYRGISEIISSFLLNFVATYIVLFMILGPMKGPNPGLAQTYYISENAILPSIIANTRAHFGFIIAILIAASVYFLMYKTVWGNKLKIVGAQPEVAVVAGLNVKRVLIYAMVISGGLAGIAGMVEVSGLHYKLLADISPGYGYIAIAVALLGKLNPAGVVMASIFMGGLMNGVMEMQRVTGIPVGIVYIVQGIVILTIIISEALLYGRRKI